MCCRFGIKLPRYNQIVNALTWMSHSQALKRMSRDYVIDLYLRPPVSLISPLEPALICQYKLKSIVQLPLLLTQISSCSYMALGKCENCSYELQMW